MDEQSVVSPSLRRWIGVLLPLLLATLAIVVVWTASHQLPVGLRARNAENVWFESDVSRVFFNITDPLSNQYRSKVHPVFALCAWTLSSAARLLGRCSFNDAADAYLAFVAACWAMLMYCVGRRLGFHPLLAAIATATGIFSAAGLLFFSVPETYSLASVSLLAALWIHLASRGRRWQSLGTVLAGAASLSITVTNWSLGLVLGWNGRRNWRRSLQLAANAFLVITALWTVQKAFMPTSEFFTACGEERRYVNVITPDRTLHRALAFVFHCVVAPAVAQTPDFGIHDDVGPVWSQGLSFQNAWPGSASLCGALAALFWLVLLLSGVHTMLRSDAPPIARSLLCFVALQLLLHLVYGVETFMYALDWMPFLLLIALFGLRRFGRPGWPLALVFFALIAINNLHEFARIEQLTQGYQLQHPLAPPPSIRDMDAHRTIEP